MSVRSLLPWLFAGALAASAYTNAVLYRQAKAPALPSPEVSHPNMPTSFHLAPGSTLEGCPTLEILGLSPEQCDLIRKCSLTSLDLRTDLALEIEEATDSLDVMLARERVDSKLVLELADRISLLRSRQYKAWIGSILVVRDVLTPEQLDLLHELESN